MRNLQVPMGLTWAGFFAGIVKTEGVNIQDLSNIFPIKMTEKSTEDGKLNQKSEYGLQQDLDVGGNQRSELRLKLFGDDERVVLHYVELVQEHGISIGITAQKHHIINKWSEHRDIKRNVGGQLRRP